MSFCAAGVPPRDILTCLQIVSKVGLCDRHDFFFCKVSDDDLHVSRLAQHFEFVCRVPAAATVQREWLRSTFF